MEARNSKVIVAAGAAVVVVMAIGVGVIVTTGGPPAKPEAAGPVAATVALDTRVFPKVSVVVGKDTTVITGPLRVDGTVDYVGALNEKYGAGVTPENNGFVLWVKAVGANALAPAVREEVYKLAGIEGVPEADRMEDYATFVKTQGGPRAAVQNPNRELVDMGRYWGTAAGHPGVVAYLEAHREVLDEIGVAVRRLRWWVPAVARDAGRVGTADTLGTLGDYGNAVRALVARAALRMKAGDFAGFESDVVAAKLLGRHMAEGPDWSSRVFGALYEGNANALVGAVAGTGELTGVQCQSLIAAFDAMPPMESSRECFDVMGRWTVLDLLEQGKMEQFEDDQGRDMHFIHVHDGEGYSPKVHDGPAAVDPNVAMRAANAVFDEGLRLWDVADARELEKLGLAFNEQGNQWWAEEERRGATFLPGADESREAYSARFGRMMATEHADPGSTIEQDRKELLIGSMTRVMLAVAAARAKNGAWPAKLEGLGVQVPVVPAPGELRYQATEAGARIYVVGANGEESLRGDMNIGVSAAAAAMTQPALP